MAKIEKVAAKTGKYKQQAYLFAYLALEYTLNKLPVRRHISARELLEGIKQYAKELYGPMARVVLEYWGVRKTEDFGQIVFALVEAGLMAKREEDSLEDFKDVYDLKEEFG
ncbi:MAG: hypothetical protein J7J76_03955 [Candidatus Latescibacteria bacterium]|nr:hypothetical protein [Candidatus Latescibacterota bacterium]